MQRTAGLHKSNQLILRYCLGLDWDVIGTEVSAGLTHVSLYCWHNDAPTGKGMNIPVRWVTHVHFLFSLTARETSPLMSILVWPSYFGAWCVVWFAMSRFLLHPQLFIWCRRVVFWYWCNVRFCLSNFKCFVWLGLENLEFVIFLKIIWPPIHFFKIGYECASPA